MDVQGRWQHRCVRPGSTRPDSIDVDGVRLSRRRTPGSGVLESGEYGGRRLHPEGNVYVAEAERSYELLRSRVWRQCARQCDAAILLLPGRTERDVPCEAAEWRRGD